MKKVLVFGMTDNPGGMESVIMNYYRHIDRSVLQFEFLCNTEKVAYEDEIRKLGGVIHNICARSKNLKQYKHDIMAKYKTKRAKISFCFTFGRRNEKEENILYFH